MDPASRRLIKSAASGRPSSLGSHVIRCVGVLVLDFWVLGQENLLLLPLLAPAATASPATSLQLPPTPPPPPVPQQLDHTLKLFEKRFKIGPRQEQLQQQLASSDPWDTAQHTEIMCELEETMGKAQSNFLLAVLPMYYTVVSARQFALLMVAFYPYLPSPGTVWTGLARIKAEQEAAAQKRWGGSSGSATQGKDT